jgi:hypothetical protein
VLWLTWRQHRTQVLAIVALLAGTGVFLLVHGLHAADVAAGVAAPDLERALHDDFRLAYQGLGWLPWVPALVGVFWGAPLLAREFERGTFRIAWTQSVSRRRWLAVKLGGLGSLATLSGLGVGAMVGAWLHVFDGTRFAERFGDDAMFGSTGVASGAWWLFAFVLGTASGAVVRRLLPAIAVTVAVFVTVLFLVIAPWSWPTGGSTARAGSTPTTCPRAGPRRRPSTWTACATRATARRCTCTRRTGTGASSGRRRESSWCSPLGWSGSPRAGCGYERGTRPDS